jgi:hypothetical protein
MINRSRNTADGTGIRSDYVAQVSNSIKDIVNIVGRGGRADPVTTLPVVTA